MSLPLAAQKSNLNPTQKAVLKTLMEFDGKVGCCPSLGTIASKVNKSSAAVCRAIKVLESEKFIRVYKISKTHFSGNGYVFLNKFVEQEPAPKPEPTFKFLKLPIGKEFCTLSPRERIVLAALLACQGRRGCFPKHSTITAKTGLNCGSVSECVNALKHKGFITITITGRANIYTFNDKIFVPLRFSNPTIGITDTTTPKTQAISIPNTRINLNHSQVYDAASQTKTQKGVTVGVKPLGKTEKVLGEILETEKEVVVATRQQNPPDSASPPLPIVDQETQEIFLDNKGQRIPLAEVEQAGIVFSEFETHARAKGLAVPNGINRFEVGQTVAMIREVGLEHSVGLMSFAIREWSTLRVSTNNDGLKLLEDPSFNQIIAPWRPRIWVARMLGIKKPKKVLKRVKSEQRIEKRSAQKVVQEQDAPKITQEQGKQNDNQRYALDLTRQWGNGSLPVGQSYASVFDRWRNV